MCKRGKNKSKKNTGSWCNPAVLVFCLVPILIPLFLMGCFPVDFQEVKRPLRMIPERGIGISIRTRYFTLPALQKNFVLYFFSCLPGNFALKNGGDFG